MTSNFPIQALLPPQSIWAFCHAIKDLATCINQIATQWYPRIDPYPGHMCVVLCKLAVNHAYVQDIPSAESCRMGCMRAAKTLPCMLRIPIDAPAACMCHVVMACIQLEG